MKRLTKAMRRKLVPFLPKLIRHWKKSAVHPSPRRCPLCNASKAHRRLADWDCQRCPVFSSVAEWTYSEPCRHYLPERAYSSRADAQRVLAYLLRLQKQVEEGAL